MELTARSGTADPRTDATLLQLVRAGDDAAFGELFARHAAAVRGYALRCCADVADAEDLAAEAFCRVFQAVRRGAGPDGDPRAYLFTVVRRLAAERSLRGRDVPVPDDELRQRVDDRSQPAPVSRVDLQLIARAFRTLPRRWRAVLWRIEVEGEPPAAAAADFGLSANATAALARRARQGLRAAYLQAHLGPTVGGTGCRPVVPKLGAYTAGQVSDAEADRIRSHLAGCPDCATRHAELADVCAGLRRRAGVPAAPLGVGLGHHLGLAKVAARVLVGARLKMAVAAVSVVAVGGLGLAAGPLVARLNPSPTVNGGVAVGPLGTLPSPSRTIGRERIAGAIHVTQRHHARSQQTGPGRQVSAAAGQPATGQGRDRRPAGRHHRDHRADRDADAHRNLCRPGRAPVGHGRGHATRPDHGPAGPEDRPAVRNPAYGQGDARRPVHNEVRPHRFGVTGALSVNRFHPVRPATA